jgi:hypothetical protein
MDTRYQFEEEKNCCGCTIQTMRIVIGVTTFLFILFTVVAFAAKVGALIAIAALCFVTSIILCCIHFCACCQAPRGADE